MNEECPILSSQFTSPHFFLKLTDPLSRSNLTKMVCCRPWTYFHRFFVPFHASHSKFYSGILGHKSHEIPRIVRDRIESPLPSRRLPGFFPKMIAFKIHSKSRPVLQFSLRFPSPAYAMCHGASRNSMNECAILRHHWANSTIRGASPKGVMVFPRKSSA